jgi:ADP-ribose pyrophosphatase YjhB (NUDIX family)
MAHIHDKIDFTAEVFVVFQNKVLLRKHDKYGIWLSVGGHIELEEDPNQAALREVKEEVGLDIELWDEGMQFTVQEENFKNLIPPVAVCRMHVEPTHEHVTFVYFARAQTDTVVPEKADDEWRWVSKEDIASMDLKDNVREYALGALSALSS